MRVKSLVIFIFLALMPVSAQAMNKNVRSVLVAGAYGIVGGTALGAISYPFTGEVRSIFIGSSVGLYLGLAVGFFHIWHRDDPENPFLSRIPTDYFDRIKLNPYYPDPRFLQPLAQVRVFRF